jgi:hypothetical protein
MFVSQPLRGDTKVCPSLLENARITCSFFDKNEHKSLFCRSISDKEEKKFHNIDTRLLRARLEPVLNFSRSDV